MNPSKKTFLEQVQRIKTERSKELRKIANDQLLNEELLLLLTDRVNDFNVRLGKIEDRAYCSDKMREVALRIEYGA